jgi:hypothetical protein
MRSDTMTNNWLAEIHPLRGHPALPAAPVALPAAGAFSLVVRAATSLHLLEGTAWVTFEGDTEDHVLEGPATFVVPRHGRVAVQALGPVRFELRAARLAA